MTRTAEGRPKSGFTAAATPRGVLSAHIRIYLTRPVMRFACETLDFHRFNCFLSESSQSSKIRLVGRVNSHLLQDRFPTETAKAEGTEKANLSTCYSSDSSASAHQENQRNTNALSTIRLICTNPASNTGE